MKTAANMRPRLLPPSALIAALVVLAGCAAMDQAAQQTQAYNIQQCQQVYGLAPGTDAYVQCVSQGPRAYADARAAANANAGAQQPPAGAMVLPIIGIPLTPAPPAGNNTCSAPKSTPLGACPGCSVSCGAKQASCSPGQEVPGGSTICLQGASCTCQ
jgi:hypothetical protein